MLWWKRSGTMWRRPCRGAIENPATGPPRSHFSVSGCRGTAARRNGQNLQNEAASQAEEAVTVPLVNAFYSSVATTRAGIEVQHHEPDFGRLVEPNIPAFDSISFNRSQAGIAATPITAKRLTVTIAAALRLFVMRNSFV